MSEKMYELQSIVINDCFCDWGVFMENVESAGMSRSALKSAAEECKSRRDLMRLVNQFI